MVTELRSHRGGNEAHFRLWILVHFSICLSLALFCITSSLLARDRWTPEQANAWYDKQPWLVGCNYIPSSAINQLEMWQAESFDPAAIDRELGWAADLGFTSVRVFLHNLVWDQDRDGFIKRIDRFLEIADKHGIGVMMVPLDGVWDPQPKLGTQPAPKPHVHNSGWVQAPGADILKDPTRHDELKAYIQGLVKHFRGDRRIQVWDLFNEPDNPNRNAYGVAGTKTEMPEKLKEEMATKLLPKLFSWAREMDPSQPLTAGVWRGDWSSDGVLTPYNKVMLDESDVISFHCYDPSPEMKKRIDFLRRYQRPLLCTEYMARGNNSHFDPILGLLKSEKIAAYNWGFVDGKSQTIYPWDTWQKKYTARPELWFHDIFYADGKPYRADEVKYIRSQTKRQTEISIREERFLINGRPTYEGRSWNGHKIEGLLMNSRMVQATFDDLNPDTVAQWAYPDTKKWDADRNTREFIDAMAAWREHGLLAFTLNLQGGSPQGYSRAQPWHNSALTETGELRPEYMERFERILNKADELGMVVILGVYYFGQDQRLKDEAAVIAGLDRTVDWVLDRGYRNVLIEVNNECDVASYDHAILKPPRVHELIERAKLKTRDGRRLLVGTSYGGGAVPRENVVKTSDFLLIHGNGQNEPAKITEQIRRTRMVAGYRPMPVVSNEDDHFDFDKPSNNFVAAVEQYCSWGFFDYRQNGESFEDGYQSVPVSWGITSPRKKAFFAKLKEITLGP